MYMQCIFRPNTSNILVVLVKLVNGALPGSSSMHEVLHTGSAPSNSKYLVSVSQRNVSSSIV